MDTTFISIHDLSVDARLLYVSNSIGDILGYHPEEVVGKPCWEYFHPDEIPFAKSIHGRGVELDKAAVLNYCKIKAKDGTWVGCECCFTIVHDVLVGCTSVYKADPKSKQRAANAPIIRQLFSSSPKDPRYHMLSYISAKFSDGPKPHVREPRAALFLNRFTRTLTIMYATNGLEAVLGIPSDELNGKSFYYCIQENCLQDAVRCLESAKANDSIAYLRFWYRDPRADDNSDHDETMSDAPSSDHDSDDEGGGVNLQPDGDTPIFDSIPSSRDSVAVSSGSSPSQPRSTGHGARLPPQHSDSYASTAERTDSGVSDPVFDTTPALPRGSSASSLSLHQRNSNQANSQEPAPRAVELEAVVSCTSDGLVVILRTARPFVPDSVRPAPTAAQPTFSNGLFASPWATEPVLPPQHAWNNAMGAPQRGVPSGPLQDDFMRTIREAAVFAWALTGINGSLAEYSRGAPVPGAQPYGGLPIWEGDERGHGYA